MVTAAVSICPSFFSALHDLWDYEGTGPNFFWVGSTWSSCHRRVRKSLEGNCGDKTVLKMAKPGISPEEMYAIGCHAGSFPIFGMIITPPMTAIVLELMNDTTAEVAKHNSIPAFTMENILQQLLAALDHLQKRLGFMGKTLDFPHFLGCRFD